MDSSAGLRGLLLSRYANQSNSSPPPNGHQAEKAQLPVRHLHQLSEGLAPSAGRDEGQQAFKDQRQAQRGQPSAAVHGVQRRVGAPRMFLKKSDDAGSITSTSPFLPMLAL